MENVSGERIAAGEKLQLFSSNGEECWLFTEDDGGELRMEN